MEELLFFFFFSTSIHLASRQKELVVRLSSVLEPSPVTLVWWCPSGRLSVSGRLGVRLICPLTTVDLLREVLILTLWWLQDGRGSNQALKWLLLFCFTVSSLYLYCGCILQNSRSGANTLGKVKCFSSMPFSDCYKTVPKYFRVGKPIKTERVWLYLLVYSLLLLLCVIPWWQVHWDHLFGLVPFAPKELPGGVSLRDNFGAVCSDLMLLMKMK